MEFYAELFAPILPHLKEYAILYIVGVPVLIGIIALTRRYSVPAIVFALEIVVFSGVMHCMVHLMVQIFSWFKNNSAMQMVRDPERDVHWTTPLFRFWERETYEPGWVIWLEVALFCVILFLVYRFRPLKPQYKHKSRYGKATPTKQESKKKDTWGQPKDYASEALAVLSERKKQR